MLNKPFLYCFVKILALIISLSIINSGSTDITFVVISALGFSCVFLFEVLLNRTIKNNRMIMITTGISMAACFVAGLDLFFPLFIILLVHLLDITVDTKMFYHILLVAVLLTFFIFLPDKISGAFSILLMIMLLLCRELLDRIKIQERAAEDQKEKVTELNKKLNDVKSLTKTLKYTVSLEERNRIAARIHDQIGHGISGSIILLEAALLIMKDNPEKATGTVQKAVTNLREGVDEIRTALREERAGHNLLGINDVTAVLEEFKVSYNKSAVVKTTGDLECISAEIWACIHDNLKECLTNVLKHSNATDFILNIEVFKKIIKIEYKDNGKSTEVFEKGMGLEAIEERTINNRGRCFFNKGESGFCVTNIFTYS